MNLKCTRSFRATVPENLLRPPAFEIAAPPNAHAPDMRKFQRAIDPAAATPFRRANVPVGMIIEGNDDDWLSNTPNQQGGQMMEVARAVKHEGRKMRFKFAVERVDQTRRRGKSQPGAPLCRIETLERNSVAIPCAVKIKMQRGRRQKTQGGVELPGVSLLRTKRRFSAAVASSGRIRNASLNCAMACEVCPNRI